MSTILKAALIAFTLAGSLSACQGSPGTTNDGGNNVIFCTTRLDCPGKLGCVEGVCGLCSRDKECLTNEWCHPLDNLCHSFGGDECRLNQECDLGSFCVHGYCKEASEVTPCTQDSDCAVTERCDPLNLVCIDDLGCNRDDDCADGEVCELASNRCVNACTPETQDVICGYGLVCDDNGRCVECFSDDQCGVGLTCNTETKRCEGENSCITNRDCLPGQTCNPQTHQCTVPPPACLSNADCADGTVCDPSLGQCIAATCHPDPFEENDQPLAAALLPPGRVDNLTLCPADLDWFAIDLVRGDRLQVIVNTDFLAADHFQIVLFDPQASEVLQEASLLIDHTVPQDAAYLLRIQTTDPRATYGLVVTISRGIPCDDDSFEPNDSAYLAAALTAGDYPGLAVCPHDEDWFVLERSLDQRLEVSIEFPVQEGDLDLDLVAGDAQTLVMRSASAGNSEFVFVDDDPGTRFFIRVYGDLETANNYEMNIELGEQ
jgi:Cys-rich repeat protein